MPGQAWESPRSRSGSKQSAGGNLTREFFVRGESNFDTARGLVEALAAVEFQGFSRKQFDWESLGYDLWRFSVPYGSAASGEDGLRPDQLSFKLGTATRHITQSLQTLYRLIPDDDPASGTNLIVDLTVDTEVLPDAITAAADIGQDVVITGGAGWTPGTYRITASGGAGTTWVLDRPPAALGTAGGKWHLSGRGPDSKSAIGTSLDAVQGADVEYPVLEFSLAARVTSMTFDLLRDLRAVVRTTNNAAWYGFAAGELLYLGCEPTSPAGTIEDASPLSFWNLNHNFRYEPNTTNVKVGAVTVPFVGGHEYVWVRYGGNVPILIPIGGLRALIQLPTAVYVERVFEASDFDDLGITL